MQLEDLPEDNKIWASYQKVKIYRQYLACQVFVQFCMDPTDRIKLVINFKDEKFVSKMSI